MFFVQLSYHHYNISISIFTISTTRDTNVEGPFFTKVMNMKGWAAKQDLITLREEPQRDIWLMHPAIVNAWYSPNHNTITFPAGILQPPFFKGGWPRYLNYGAIGMVIGHEITHGFDGEQQSTSSSVIQ